ncbi:MAG TPA: SOS response-associated peptidase [Polyangiaceae bacterium]|nr:SOS response-associated peptidase [Polyangiaceae bacterium]
MCGRTALTASPADLRDAFGLEDIPELGVHYNVPPSSPVAVVRVVRASGGRKLEALRWGLIPPWAKDPKIGHKLALARAETVATTGAFRDAFRSRRCLVAVDGFYEWHREGKAPSAPFFVRRADRRPFALAGLWSRWVADDGEVIESCAIVTQPARPPVEAIHDRMPLVLEPEAWDRWLDPGLTDAGVLESLLVSLLEPGTPDLIAYPVSSYVNDPRHDDAGCLEPAAEPVQRSLF